LNMMLYNGKTQRQQRSLAILPAAFVRPLP
jgi:hypothetical protein